MAFDKKKFLKRFVEETSEHLQAISSGLLVLEKEPENEEVLNDIFRSAHTIKGSSKIMKLAEISDLAHRLEDALDSVRKGSVSFSEELSDIFFKSVDAASEMLERAGAGKALSELSEELCQNLENIAKGQKIKTVASGFTALKETAAKGGSSEKDQQSTKEESASTITRQDETVRISGEKLDNLIKLMGEIVSGHARMKMRMIELGRIDNRTRKIALKRPVEAKNPDFESGSDYEPIRKLSREVTKFFTGINDDIMTLEGLTDELQKASLNMRMLPVSTIFEAFRRLVRDQARASGKEVSFFITGEETELDKKILEKISDPLIHMIRNSIDHGLERAERRIESGKNPAGTLKLSAEYEGGNVLIRLSDDGFGISPGKIKEKAFSRGLFSEKELNDFSGQEILDLIFYPGFSTSERITDISGRGVGLDVAKKNIVRDLSGSVRVFSKEEKGTSFEIRVPLTLAVMHMMVVDIAMTIFAVLSANVDEVLRVERADLIDVVDKKAVKVRDQIIPVVKLQDILGLSSLRPEPENLLVLIVSVGIEKMGFIIDDLLREEKRTVKPLPEHLKNNPYIQGVTISGSRMLDNVLNIPKIMEAAKKTGNAISSANFEYEPEKMTHILVVDDSVSTREIEKSILESYGYNVSLAGDGIEALENADKFQYDLVVTDIEMPKMDGLALTKHLKNKDSYKDVPVILISSRDKEEDKKRGLDAGADAYIVKDDFDQNSLIDVIKNLVGD